MRNGLARSGRWVLGVAVIRVTGITGKNRVEVLVVERFFFLWLRSVKEVRL